MCGIIGYLGDRSAESILLDSLQRLEYRGYDSAGIACIHPSSHQTNVRKSVGKLANLRQIVQIDPLSGNIGIGHTRWATHGKPTELNAHPHRSGRITLVHNGIIENHHMLKERLVNLGHRFESETDTEVIAHLIASLMDEQQLSLAKAVQKAVQQLEGAFALVVMDEANPHELVGVKQACPLLLGIGKNEMFLASDFPAVLSYTQDFVILEDQEMVVITKSGYQVFSFEGLALERKPLCIELSPLSAEKEGYKHFMRKEIAEQPRAIIDTLRGRFFEAKGEIDLDGLNADVLHGIDRIHIVACGTSYLAGLLGKHGIEALAQIPVDVELASEYRYRKPLVGPNTLVIGISQSGETADTLAALVEAKKHQARLLAICNQMASSIARLCDQSAGTLYTRAGVEVSVASTKAFTTQLVLLQLLALLLAQRSKRISPEALLASIEELSALPLLVEQVIKQEDALRSAAQKLMHVEHMLYLGRGSGYVVALEGALKMKELAYIHAEGYAAGEMKHGPIALIDHRMPTVALCLKSFAPEKLISNLQEINARQGHIIAISDCPSEQLSKMCDTVIEIPQGTRLQSPVLATVAVQLLAYHMADLKGLDVDQPRNLAKSVTVE